MAARRIEICGGIGVGKSTVAVKVAKRLTDHQIVHEDYSGNPLWHFYYENPELYWKEKNISLLTQHVAEIKAVGNFPSVIDFCLLQDLAYAKISKNPEHYDVMSSVLAHLANDIDAPSVIIHITSSLERQMSQISERGRPEEASLTAQLLGDLNRATEEVIHDLASKETLVIKVSNEEFHKNEFAIDLLVQQYQEHLDRRSHKSPN